jgi:hypothetical protein
MDLSSSVVLWQVRQGHAQFRCVMEQLGEECFELELFRGQKKLMSESFDDPAPLLALADALRADISKPKHHTH